jgi:uncharacterized membrane protein YgcG
MDFGIKRGLSRILCLAVGLLVFWSPVAAAPVYPALTGRVIDGAGVLPASVEDDLAAQSQALEARTTDQFVVITVPSLQGVSIEEYSLGLGKGWRLGQIGKNNGVLLVIAPNERKVRIEPGSGLETVLDHTTSQAIIQDVILPLFRKGQLAKGVSDGAEAIIKRLDANAAPAPSAAVAPQALAAPAAPVATPTSASVKSDNMSSLFALVVVCLIFFVIYKVVVGVLRVLVGLIGLAFRPRGEAGAAPDPLGATPQGLPQGGMQQGFSPRRGYGFSPLLNLAGPLGAGAAGAMLANWFFNRNRGGSQRIFDRTSADEAPSYTPSSSGTVSAGGGSFGSGGFSGGGGSFGGAGGASGSW